MEIARSEEAKRDLLEIWRHIAQDDPNAADRTLRAIDRKISMLSKLPYMGRPRPGLAPGLRGLISEPYLVLYRVGGDVIEIVRVVHGRRNLQDLV